MTPLFAAAMLGIIGLFLLGWGFDEGTDEVPALILKVVGAVFTLPALSMLWLAVVFG